MGTRFTPASGSQYTGSIMGDGSGGAFIAWYDNRNPAPVGPPYSVYVQRITQEGVVAAGWPQDGLPVCSDGCTEYAPRLASDGAGGIFVAWQRDTVIAGSSGHCS
jgi:hypothetical protein